MPEAGRTRLTLTHLRAWRVRKGYSQEELAKLAKVAKSTVTNLENAKATANFTTVGKLATALGITREQLLYMEPEHK